VDTMLWLLLARIELPQVFFTDFRIFLVYPLMTGSLDECFYE
jgi:hypothetical protein